MKTINCDDTDFTLSALIEDMEKSKEPILIYSKGKPVADLIPHLGTDRLTPHPLMKNIVIKYDPTEPLTDDEWQGDK